MVSKATKVCMIIVAVFIDAIEFVTSFFLVGEIISPFLNVFSQLLFWFWFKINDVDFLGSRRIGYFVFGSLIETIPVIDALPGLTIEILLIFSTLKIEEKVAQKVPGGSMAVGLAKSKFGASGNPKNFKEAYKTFKVEPGKPSLSARERRFSYKKQDGHMGKEQNIQNKSQPPTTNINPQ